MSMYRDLAEARAVLASQAGRRVDRDHPFVARAIKQIDTARASLAYAFRETPAHAPYLRAVKGLAEVRALIIAELGEELGSDGDEPARQAPPIDEPAVPAEPPATSSTATSSPAIPPRPRL